jgi:hypothetical protein
MGIRNKAPCIHELFHKDYEFVEMALRYSYAGRTQFWIEIYANIIYYRPKFQNVWTTDTIVLKALRQ